MALNKTSGWLLMVQDNNEDQIQHFEPTCLLWLKRKHGYRLIYGNVTTLTIIFNNAKQQTIQAWLLNL